MNYTESDIKALGPFRTDVASAFGGQSLSLWQIVLQDLDPVDRIWIAVKLLPAKLSILFGCDCAERALNDEADRGGVVDPRSARVVAVARSYACGDATKDELRAACYAAWAVSGSATTEELRAIGRCGDMPRKASAATIAYACAYRPFTAALLLGDDHRAWQLEVLSDLAWGCP